MAFPEEAALIDALAVGDEEAATAFCAQFGPRVLSLARGKRIPAQDCEAVVQEVLATALQQLRKGQFRGEARVGTWVYRIAICKVADYWRSAGGLLRTGSVEVRLTLSSEPYVVSPQEVVLSVREVVRQLQPEERLVLWLHDAEGWTLEEIGRLIGRRKSAVAERLRAARDRFREILTRDARKPTR